MKQKQLEFSTHLHANTLKQMQYIRIAFLSFSLQIDKITEIWFALLVEIK